MNQQTLKNKVSCHSGIGLHSGEKVLLNILPAKPGRGISFKRTDIKDKPNEIKALWSNVSDTNFCTKISNRDGVTVSTIEHLMAALYAKSIDNAIIEIDNEEIPIMDGSSEPFIKLIEQAGILEQPEPRKHLNILKTISIKDDERDLIAELHPTSNNDLELDITYDFRGRASIPAQNIITNVKEFDNNISRARTFGLKAEIDLLKANNLAKGGSLDNAIVVDGGSILNEGGLRYDSEFARHKALDAIGDLYTAGYQIRGKFVGKNCGHGLNNKLLEKLFSKEYSDCYEVV